MSRDVAIENWLASINKSELIAQCFFWHDMALEHGHMYNVVNAENAKLREYIERKRHLQDFVRLVSENARLREACAELLKMAERHDPEWLYWSEIHDELRELGVEVDT